VRDDFTDHSTVIDIKTVGLLLVKVAFTVVVNASQVTVLLDT
jgi:hypothetical protein